MIQVAAAGEVRNGAEGAAVGAAEGRGHEPDGHAEAPHDVGIPVVRHQVVARCAFIHKVGVGVASRGNGQGAAGGGFAHSGNRPAGVFGGERLNQGPKTGLSQPGHDVIDFGPVEKGGIGGGVVAANHHPGGRAGLDLAGNGQNGIGFTGHPGNPDKVGGKPVQITLEIVGGDLQIEDLDLVVVEIAGKGFQGQGLSPKDGLDGGQAESFLGDAATTVGGVDEKYFHALGFACEP